MDDDDDDDDDDDEDSQNVENEHILFENNDAVTEDILTSSASTNTTSTTTSSSNFDLNNDYDQFQLNFPEAGVNQGRIDGSISTSAYQMQRDDVSNREGTISIAEMMCTKSKSWEGNATSSMKGMDLYQFQLHLHLVRIIIQNLIIIIIIITKVKLKEKHLIEETRSNLCNNFMSRKTTKTINIFR